MNLSEFLRLTEQECALRSREELNAYISWNNGQKLPQKVRFSSIWIGQNTKWCGKFM